MASKLSHFPHRRVQDGLYDSICPACFATVARSKPKTNMAEIEKAHVCNSSFLAERGHFSRPESQPRAAPRPSARGSMVFPISHPALPEPLPRPPLWKPTPAPERLATSPIGPH